MLGWATWASDARARFKHVGEHLVRLNGACKSNRLCSKSASRESATSKRPRPNCCIRKMAARPVGRRHRPRSVNPLRRRRPCNAAAATATSRRATNLPGQRSAPAYLRHPPRAGQFQPARQPGTIAYRWPRSSARLNIAKYYQRTKGRVRAQYHEHLPPLYGIRDRWSRFS